MNASDLLLKCQAPWILSFLIFLMLSHAFCRAKLGIYRFWQLLWKLGQPWCGSGTSEVYRVGTVALALQHPCEFGLLGCGTGAIAPAFFWQFWTLALRRLHCSPKARVDYWFSPHFLLKSTRHVIFACLFHPLDVVFLTSCLFHLIFTVLMIKPAQTTHKLLKHVILHKI